MIYLFRKNNKNSDSSLVRVNYFDSAGNWLEKDEFRNNRGSPSRITNYSYLSNLLSKTESTEGNSDSTISTFEYDSLGNQVNAKVYSYYSSYTGNHRSFFEQTWDYDSNHHISKVYAKLDSADFKLLNSYHYNGNYLKEIKTYTETGTWSRSNLYEYDTIAKRERIYTLFGSDKKLEAEYSFNENEQLIEAIFFRYSADSLRHRSKASFEYYENGLVYKERTSFENGQVDYLKHYYFKK